MTDDTEPRTPKNDDEYYHDATRNDPDPATVELRPRPRPQSNTIHPTSLNCLNSSKRCPRGFN